MADYVDVSTLDVKENRFHDLDMFYDNKRMFADREKDSAELLDFLDQLNNAGVDYEEYKHKTDPGCTIFYDDNKSLTEERRPQEQDKPLFIIRDSKGNQLSAPNSDDEMLWDRVASMEARGRRGLCVVAYTGKKLSESTEFDDDVSNIRY